MKRIRFSSTMALLFGVLAIGGRTLDAQSQFSPNWGDKSCRTGSANALAGSWRANLSITNLGASDSLMSLSEGGGLIETDAIDLVDPNVVHSPGYGTVKATGCRHYDVTIVKFLYSHATKEAQTTELHGSVVSSADGNSWSGELHQQFFNSNGQVVFTDTVTVTATRIQASASE